MMKQFCKQKKCTNRNREDYYMKKNLKWIVPVILILIVTFAPLPVPHFATFHSVCNANGQPADVIVRVSFLHFKPLFFQYGGQNEGYFSFGIVNVYESSSTALICTLNLDTGSPRVYSEDTYIADLIQYDEQNAATDCGYLIWDNNCDNIVLTANASTFSPEENIQTNDIFHYTASKADALAP